MTIIAGKKTINLGWETALAIMISVIGTTFAASATVVKYLAAQQKMYHLMEVALNNSEHNTKRLDILTPAVALHTHDLDSIKKAGKLVYSHRPNGFVTEHKTARGIEVIQSNEAVAN